MFFAVVFPLMFLVLFGGLFSDQSPAEGRDDRGRQRRRCSTTCRRTRRQAFDETFDGRDSPTTSTPRSPRCARATPTSRSSSSGDTLVAHYTQTDPASAAITQGALRAFVDGTNVAATGQPPTYSLEDGAGRGRLARHDPVLHARAARLGGRDERGVRRRRDPAGLAADQAAAPAPARAGLDAHRGRRAGLGHGRRSRWCRWRSSSGVGTRVLRPHPDRRLVDGDPAAGRRHPVLHGDRPARRRDHQDPGGRGQRRQLHGAADGVPLRLVLPARRRPAVAADVLATCCRSSTSTTACST